MKKWIWTLVFVLAIGAAALSAGLHSRAQAKPDDTILEGVYAGDISLSGMTREEAKAAIQSYVDSLASSTITLNVVEGNTVNVTASELGLGWANPELVEEAVNLGKSGNVMVRYKALKDLEHQNKVYDIAFSFDREAIASVVENKCDAFYVEAVNAHLKRVDGAFVIEDGQTGVVVDNAASENAIYDYLTTQWKGGDAAVDLAVTEEVPQGNKEELAKVKDVLGSYTTSFSFTPEKPSPPMRPSAPLLRITDTIWPVPT